MRNRTLWGWIAGLPLLGLACHTAQAQIPVTDVGAITQLVLQVLTAEQQLTTLKDQFTQAQATYAAMTGPRGMEGLLGGTVRNYLPGDWAALANVIDGTSGTFAALAATLNGAIRANAVLTDAQLAALGPDDRAALMESRRTVATLQVLARSALQNSSARFDALQGLIAAIPTATDEKGALDLHARIAAEQAMLQNEQTKVQMLMQTAAAQDLAVRERNRERAIVSIGSLRDLPAMGLR